MKRLLCKLFGHRWIYGNFYGMQRQPKMRACKRCACVQKHYGSSSAYTEHWYIKIDWMTPEKFDAVYQKVLDNKKTFDKLTKTKT